ncbi:hypothetical protein [Hyphomicrobium sp. MC1]|uniref:hypothetical protein n=1 Tax=Hyphomicrobium sp. (strain MC1) TaxID=717785 RepID=UPI000213D823|nr:hypothetical protein [Hyphomicrobium sp. MC1]CCB65053.1 protein of unknown function [Hyphomicrobium sp. MC1]
MPALSSVALCCLLDGAADDWAESASRFLQSYQQLSAGRDHTFYLLLFGFFDDEKLQRARSKFGGIAHAEIIVSGDGTGFKIYREAVGKAPEDLLCFIGSDCEILGDLWLAKLVTNLEMPDVGLVGVAGSYRSRIPPSSHIFPNIHLCTDVWAIRRGLLINILRDGALEGTPDREALENGPANLTERVTAIGKEVLAVGRNGRGYGPRWWPRSETYYRGTQSNLLISTRRSRAFNAMPWNDKLLAAQEVWGVYLDDSSMNLLR